MFFFELWKYVNYNFIVTFIVDNFIEQLIKSNFTINKKISNVWHARLKYLRKQNVRRLVNMFERMNLIKIVVNKNLRESCIQTKQEAESHNNSMISDKHSLNLIWSDLVQCFVAYDNVK